MTDGSGVEGTPERQVEVVVSVDDDHVGDLPEVIARMEAVGMEVTEVQEMLGTVTGRVPASALQELGQLDGVHIEPSRDYQLPPPDSTLQGGPAGEDT